MNLRQKIHSEEDLEYMESLSAAVLQKAPIKSKAILWIILGVTTLLIIWANFAHVDELARGSGKVIPSKQVQVVQNLEGGIVSDILAQEGQRVEKGQILVKIDDTSFSSSYKESHLRYHELKAKALRLKAESSAQPFQANGKNEADMSDTISQEQSLYNLNRNQLEQQISILKEQAAQRENELREAKAKEQELKTAYNLISEEVRIMRPLVQSGLVSQVEFLQLSRQATATKGELNAVTLSIPRIRSAIAEARNKIENSRLEFRSKAKEEQTQVTAELSRLSESEQALEDRVNRTLVRSPVRGIVKQLFIKTINGVVQPGMNIVEIVPLDDELLIEAKIKPSDIAYIYPGQTANVKFTAYDFSVYGGLKGTVTHVSADTILDDEGNSFYLVRIKTDKSYLQRKGKKFDIMVGMVATVDIVTGKKTIMEYIIKPLMKAKEGALTER